MMITDYCLYVEDMCCILLLVYEYVYISMFSITIIVFG